MSAADARSYAKKMSASELLGYYRAHACPLQWRGFLCALGDEFEDALSDAELTLLMSRIGGRFAQAHPLPDVDTLDALQAALNAIWNARNWGYVVFEELPDRVLIRHGASPLASALGGERIWAAGFLEGAYREWFRAAGMLAGLDVRMAAPQSADVADFVLSRVS
nr:cellulose biosynthesis protein BcsD [Luteimonas sp. BDR2-5]